MKLRMRHPGPAGSPARPPISHRARGPQGAPCRNCGAPSVFCVYEPGRLVNGYCREHFHRLVHVRDGARVTWA